MIKGLPPSFFACCFNSLMIYSRKTTAQHLLPPQLSSRQVRTCQAWSGPSKVLQYIFRAPFPSTSSPMPPVRAHCTCINFHIYSLSVLLNNSLTRTSPFSWPLSNRKITNITKGQLRPYFFSEVVSISLIRYYLYAPLIL